MTTTKNNNDDLIISYLTIRKAIGWLYVVDRKLHRK
jgi:hypothetical protein